MTQPGNVLQCNNNNTSKILKLSMEANISAYTFLQFKIDFSDEGQLEFVAGSGKILFAKLIKKDPEFKIII